MEDVQGLREALDTVLSEGMIDDADAVSERFGKDTFFGSGLNDHIAVIDRLSRVEDRSEPSPGDVLSGIEASDTVTEAEDMIHSHREGEGDAEDLRRTYLYYSEAWASMHAVKEELESLTKEKVAALPEWDGTRHRCGFVGSTSDSGLVCNECRARSLGKDFVGPHSPYIFAVDGEKSRSITCGYRPRRFGSLIESKGFGETMLKGVYSLQDKICGDLF